MNKISTALTASAGKDKNQESREIINEAEKIDADVIISNYPNAIYTGATIQKSHIPIMSIIHNVYPMTSIIQRINGLTHHGHSVFLVSKWQHNRYKELVEKIRKRPFSRRRYWFYKKRNS